MKKLLLALLITLFCATFAHAAGTVTITPGYADEHVFVLQFNCTGDAADGDVPNTSTGSQTYLGRPFTDFIKGWYLYNVCAIPGGTAPTDATDIFIMHSGDADDSVDLLGSIDGGTTAYGGLNLLSNTTMQCANPSLWVDRAGEQFPYYPVVLGDLTLIVAAEQAVNSATWIVELTFVR